jgi:hypothetical protein
VVLHAKQERRGDEIQPPGADNDSGAKQSYGLSQFGEKAYEVSVIFQSLFFLTQQSWTLFSIRPESVTSLTGTREFTKLFSFRKNKKIVFRHSTGSRL